MGSIIRELGRELTPATAKGIEKAAKKLGARVRQQMKNPAESVRLLICGYEEGQSHAVSVVVKSSGVALPKDGPPAIGPGVTVNGEGYVVQTLWALAKERKSESGLAFFSLRDGIEYAKFLIRLTGDYQRFALEPQTVGGGIDVGIIDQLEGFKWVQKASHVVLEK